VSVLPYFYRGEISASKSIMNRALLVKSFFSDLLLKGDSNCDDVLHMKSGLKSFINNEKEIFCGDAGTVFRFLGVRASRVAGEFFLTGSARLLERPHKDIIDLLSQFNVEASLEKNGLKIKSSGWKKPKEKIIVPREKSSQFATGFLFSCWDLPFDLEFELNPKGLRDSYWELSLKMAQDMGMVIQSLDLDTFRISANQKVNLKTYSIEPDMSSVFAIAAVAALVGDIHIQNIGSKSLQPDYKFIEILNKMKIFTELSSDQENYLTSYLAVSCTDKFIGVDVNMEETPDLFPVLSILCAFAEGPSHLFGAPRLAFKESNRILKTSELLNLMGVQNEPLVDGIKIQGRGRQLVAKEFEFNPDYDHRMAMAAGLLLRLGWPIKIKTPEVVQKSFPEFWKVLGVNL
jgi:3-phosphoshikimate 1-carboxyvinyltransferase